MTCNPAWEINCSIRTCTCTLFKVKLVSVCWLVMVKLFILLKTKFSDNIIFHFPLPYMVFRFVFGAENSRILQKTLTRIKGAWKTIRQTDIHFNSKFCIWRYFGIPPIDPFYLSEKRTYVWKEATMKIKSWFVKWN